MARPNRRNGGGSRRPAPRRNGARNPGPLLGGALARRFKHPIPGVITAASVVSHIGNSTAYKVNNASSDYFTKWLRELKAFFGKGALKPFSDGFFDWCVNHKPNVLATMWFWVFIALSPHRKNPILYFLAAAVFVSMSVDTDLPFVAVTAGLAFLVATLGLPSGERNILLIALAVCLWAVFLKS